jgi:hypothetical protein
MGSSQSNYNTYISIPTPLEQQVIQRSIRLVSLELVLEERLEKLPSEKYRAQNIIPLRRCRRAVVLQISRVERRQPPLNLARIHAFVSSIRRRVSGHHHDTVFSHLGFF